MKIALVGTVGDSIVPLIEHINVLKPNLVFFIHSKKTKKFADDIKNKTDAQEYRYTLLNNHEDVHEAFSKSLDCINVLLKEDFNVIGNFTAGTKTMSAGLAMACVEKGCQYEYGTGNRNEFGTVTTYGGNIPQENPYEKQAIHEFKRGKLFFDNYQFLAARENIKLAKIKLDNSDSNLDKLKQQADIFIRIIDFYDYWDKFNDDDGEISLNLILTSIIKTIESDEYLSDYFSTELPNFFNQMKNNLIFLDKKLDDNLFYYLPDLLNNAQRRIEEGKYDDAVARLYRAIELVAQLRLMEFKIVDDDTFIHEKYFRIDKSKIISKTSKNTQFQVSNLNRNKWKKEEFLEYDMTKDYWLLQYISNEKDNDLTKTTLELVNFFKNIKNNIQIRNKSILAHGLKPLNENDAIRINRLVLKHSQKLCSNIDNEMELAKFPLFKEG